MIIIETCPKCGHDLMDEVICTYLPIPRKVCHNCGWNWEGKREEVIRVPFTGNSIIDDLTSYDHLEVELNGTTLLNDYHSYDGVISAFEQSACINCSNNPKNGGSGICHCTLGQMHIAY